MLLSSDKAFRTGNKKAATPRAGHAARRLPPLALQQAIDFLAQSSQVIEAKIDDGVADVRNLIHLLESMDEHIADHTRRDFRFAHVLQFGFDVPNQTFDVCDRYRTLRAGDAD